MAHILETHFGIAKDHEGNLTAVKYFVPAPLFGTSIPDDMDALVIENNGPFWLGHTVNLYADGDEIVLNVLMDKGMKELTDNGTLQQVVEFIRNNGRIEICEQVINPENLQYQPRTHTVKAEYFESYRAFIMGYRHEAHN